MSELLWLLICLVFGLLGFYAGMKLTVRMMVKALKDCGMTDNELLRVIKAVKHI